jgi:cytoskeletal protein CcmA (bactofilin family)
MTKTQLTKQLEALGIKDSIETTIGDDIEFHGKLVIKNGSGIAIFGKVVGEIESDGAVVIGEGGVVTGTLCADVVAIAGTVENLDGADDRIHARGSLVLGATARIGSKSIHYGAIEMERGCRIDGTLTFIEPSLEVQERRDRRLKNGGVEEKPAATAVLASLQQTGSSAPARPLPVISPADRGASMAPSQVVSASSAVTQALRPQAVPTGLTTGFTTGMPSGFAAETGADDAPAARQVAA